MGQTQTRPVMTSIRPQVRVSVSHMLLLEGVCVSHVTVCTVLRMPAPSEAPPDVLVPAEGQADRAAAWAHGAAGTRAPGDNLT